MEGFIGEVKLFAGTFAPRNWAFCEGQLLAIQQFTSLYSIIGDQYGGDGRTTFGLPDLRGRVPVGVGAGPGLTPIRASEKGGYERIQMTQDNIPAHNHQVKCGVANQTRDQKNTPESAYPGQSSDTNLKLYGTKKDKHMASDMIDNTGGNQPLYNMQPFMGMHYIICTDGEYPQRP